MRERYQRPGIQDLGTRWRISYWDYQSVPRRRRSKVWAKSIIPSKRQAQALADDFITGVNSRNNRLIQTEKAPATVGGIVNECRDKLWPHLKNSTRANYDYFIDKYLAPKYGSATVDQLHTVELQGFFNTLAVRLSPKTVRNAHACLRTILNQGKSWGLIKFDSNPTTGVRLPRKSGRRSVLLTPEQTLQLIDALPSPTKEIATLIVLGSMRVGEVAALRWDRIHRTYIDITQRYYEGEFDDVKTDAGQRRVPIDGLGIMSAALQRIKQSSGFTRPTDLVFCTRKGTAINRRNLLIRHLKPTLKHLGLPSIGFHDLRRLHSSLMGRVGARPEIARDNMGHASVDVTQNIYGATWWDERTEAVTRAAALVWQCVDNSR